MSSPPSTDPDETLIEIPFEQLNPQTLRRMIEEFVTADWSDFGEANSDLAGKVDQVLGQLRKREAKIVFDLKTERANIVPSR